MDRKQFLLDEAAAIADKAEAEGRQLTDDEQKTVESMLAKIKEWDAQQAWVSGDFSKVNDEALLKLIKGRRDSQALQQIMGAVSTKDAGHAGSGFAETIIESGWSLKGQSTVTVDGFKALGLKDVTVPSAETYARVEAGLNPLGQDQRFLFRALPAVNLEENTAVQDFRQTGSRTVDGNVERDTDSTADKAELDVTVENSVVEVRQFAVVLEAIPNQILESIDGFRAYLNSEGQFQVEKALDAHVVAQIAAASPADTAEGLNLVERIRFGVRDMRANGASPSILAAGPTDSAELDLFQTGADDNYVFATRATGSSSPLWGNRLVETPAVTGDPILIDPQLLGRVYIGRMKFDADPFTGFRKNLTNIRIEVNGLFHVRQSDGAQILGEESS
jgi:hypothetical protein